MNRAPESETYSGSGIIKVAEGSALKTEKFNKNPTPNMQNKETQGNDADGEKNGDGEKGWSQAA